MSRPSPTGLVWLFVLAACWLAAPAPRAAAGVTAEVEPRETEFGQPVVLRVRVTGEAPADIDLSPLAAFSVIPRGRALGTRTEAGRVVPVAAYRFELSPRRDGDLEIPPLAVTQDGLTVHTPALRVLVRPRAGPPPELAGQDLLLTARVGTDEPFVGERFRYTLRLFRLVAVESATISPPEFPDFAVTPLPGQRDSEVTFGGRRYAVTEVAYQLTARRDGRVTLGPGTAVCREAPAPDRPGGGRTRTVTGPERTVTVRPLPPFAGPGRFAGVLAGATLTARLEAPGNGQGPGPVLAVTVTGQGDLAAVGAPSLALPRGQRSRTLPPGEPEPARRTFRYALGLAPPDSREIPEATLTVFDPIRAAYLTLRAKPETPVPAVAKDTPPPLPELSAAATEGTDLPSWPLALLGVLAGPTGYLALRLRQARRSRLEVAARTTPSALAEALRDLASRPGGGDDAGIRDILRRLDRLLYSGQPADPKALAATMDEARRVLAGRPS